VIEKLGGKRGEMAEKTGREEVALYLAYALILSWPSIIDREVNTKNETEKFNQPANDQKIKPKQET
jgi:hypothetical protein